MTTIIENLKWRYATKGFDTSKELPAADLDYILEAGRMSATSFGLQPFKIVMVTDEAKKQTLMGHAWNQAHVGENSALIILAARTDVDEAMIADYTARIEATRGLPAGAVDGYKDMMVGSLTSRPIEHRTIWAQKQCYIALGTMMMAAAERGVDSCPMEGFSSEGFDEVLGLTAHNLTASVILPVGYHAESDATQHYAKVRRTAEDMIVRM
ncbi:NAD(P)H-dependent oxidoreductase [Patescibacteria group bacterium]|nr:NAD(P)H-dependent oxidoreductase [Patescibacteria group bacterium]